MAFEGYVSAIQRSCLSDGPGIRTVVFLQGCPLHCPWCHNPETRPFTPTVSIRAERCLGCGLCHRDPDTETCPGGARFLSGRKMTVEKVMKTVRRDLDFYRESGGGLTISGGEPMAQPEFTKALFAAAKAEGIHTAIETSGAYSLLPLRPVCDLFLFDIKAAPERYSEWIGIPWETVETHLRELSKDGASIRLRVPLVAGWNFEDKLLKELQVLARLPGVEDVDILPYHDLGRGKARLANLPEAPWETMSAPSPDELKRWKDQIAFS